MSAVPAPAASDSTGMAFLETRTRRLVDFAGILGNPLGRPVTVDEMHEAVLDEAAERYRRTKR